MPSPETMTKADMVQEALNEGYTKPTEGSDWIKEKFHVEMRPSYFTQVKAILKRRNAKGPTSRGKYRARAQKAAETRKRNKENRPAIKFNLAEKTVEVYFCPRCGANIEAVRSALKVAFAAQEAFGG